MDQTSVISIHRPVAEWPAKQAISRHGRHSMTVWSNMKIYVDADANPNKIKEILYRAAERVKVPLILVANQVLKIPSSEYITFILAETGPDEADHIIAQMVQPGDLAVTTDIPLADRVVAKGAFALDPRGDLYTTENIKTKLALRNLMTELRNSGMRTDGPPPLDQRSIRAFAAQLDSILAKNTRNTG